MRGIIGAFWHLEVCVITVSLAIVSFSKAGIIRSDSLKSSKVNAIHARSGEPLHFGTEEPGY